MGQRQRSVFAARPLQLAARLVAAAVRAAHRLALCPRADDPAVTVPVADQPLRRGIQQRVRNDIFNLTFFSFFFSFHLTVDVRNTLSRFLAPRGTAFLLAPFAFFLVILFVNKGCIQRNLKLCQTNVQNWTRGSLPQHSAAAAFLCLGYCDEGASGSAPSST